MPSKTTKSLGFKCQRLFSPQISLNFKPFVLKPALLTAYLRRSISLFSSVVYYLVSPGPERLNSENFPPWAKGLQFSSSAVTSIFSGHAFVKSLCSHDLVMFAWTFDFVRVLFILIHQDLNTNVLHWSRWRKSLNAAEVTRLVRKPMNKIFPATQFHLISRIFKVKDMFSVPEHSRDILLRIDVDRSPPWPLEFSRRAREFLEYTQHLPKAWEIERECLGN